MQQTPFEFYQQRNGILLFHRGIPYCLFPDKNDYGNMVFWQRHLMSGQLGVRDRFECLAMAIASIDRHLLLVLCQVCQQPTLNGNDSSDGRYRCLKCSQVADTYLWRWDETHTDYEVCENSQQWQPDELGLTESGYQLH